MTNCTMSGHSTTELHLTPQRETDICMCMCVCVCVCVRPCVYACGFYMPVNLICVT